MHTGTTWILCAAVEDGSSTSLASYVYIYIYDMYCFIIEELLHAGTYQYLVPGTRFSQTGMQKRKEFVILFF